LYHFLSSCYIIVFALALLFLHIFYTASKILLTTFEEKLKPKEQMKLHTASDLRLQEGNPAHHVGSLVPVPSFLLGMTAVRTMCMVSCETNSHS